MKKYNAVVNLNVVAGYEFQAESTEQYLEGIGQTELIQYSNEPLYIKLINGQILKLNLMDITVEDVDAEEVEE